MRLWKSLVLAGLATLVFSGTAPAYCNSQYSCGGYNDDDSHPLRIVSYALHPVGYTLEWLIMRPIHALVSQPELCPVFGYTPGTWGCDDGAVANIMPVGSVAPPLAAPTVNPADLEAARRAADEARQAADEARRAADEATRAADRSMKASEKGLQK